MRTTDERTADLHLPAVLDRMANNIARSEHMPLHIPDEKAAADNAPPPTVYREEAHAHFELVYIDEGACNIVTNQQNIDIKQGDILLIPPHHNHYIVPKTGIYCRVLWLGLELNYVGLHTVQYSAEGRRMIECVTIPSDTSVRSLIGQIYREASNKALCAEYMVKGYLLALTGYVCRPVKYMAYSGIPSALSGKDEVTYNAITFMEECYDNPHLSVTDMARHVAMSASYFSSHFRQVTGYTPYQYLLQRRLERAGHLLCTTIWPIDRICRAVGFQHPHHFSSTFKRAFGMTPTAFRRRALTRSIPMLPLIHHQ